MTARRQAGPVDQAAALEAIYAQVPQIECLGKCHTSCTAIMMTTVEHDRIEAASGLDIPNGGLAGVTTGCKALTMFKSCRVYPLRPLICRLWGVTLDMPCPYGCRPARYLTAREADELLAQAATVDGDHVGASFFRSRTAR